MFDASKGGPTLTEVIPNAELCGSLMDVIKRRKRAAPTTNVEKEIPLRQPPSKKTKVEPPLSIEEELRALIARRLELHMKRMNNVLVAHNDEVRAQKVQRCTRRVRSASNVKTVVLWK